MALIYAFLTGLKTVGNFDVGWQMATARWIVQHHQIPSTDVLSYTAAGRPWTYPGLSGLIFYGAFLLGGFAMLSWLAAAEGAITVWLLLRRASAITAGLAILAVPLITSRTAPLAEMFTIVFFAAALSLLWEQYETGRAVVATTGGDGSLGESASGVSCRVVSLRRVPCAGRNCDATERGARSSRRACAPVLAVAGGDLRGHAAESVGMGMYQMALRDETARSQSTGWAPRPLDWPHLRVGFNFRDPDGIYLLLIVAFPGWQRRRCGAAWRAVCASLALVTMAGVRVPSMPCAIRTRRESFRYRFDEKPPVIVRATASRICRSDGRCTRVRALGSPPRAPRSWRGTFGGLTFYPTMACGDRG